MKIACLSGKGGAGKTFVAVNLAAAAGHATYIDCDVEEPNGELFFRPNCVKEETVYSLLPEFDGDYCNGCKKMRGVLQIPCIGLYQRETDGIFRSMS